MQVGDKDLAQHYMQGILRQLGAVVQKCLPRKWGFCIFIFQPGTIHHIANLPDVEVVPYLKLFLEQGEKSASSRSGEISSVSEANKTPESSR